ncbi:MAG TPA: HlyD family efflux transporter periplasmic adaptor subunit [Puia sp.]|jgi:HlyD family secretion protein|nr:HlyD family efflux transporter periplasmic adaptor subunit [Puia sp.]
MSYLFPSEILQDSTYTWLPKVRVKTQLIYTASLVLLVVAIMALPFIKVDVSANGAGLVRPVAEKNELHSIVSGTIEEVLAAEGQHVEKGQLLIRLQQDLSNNKLSQTAFELQQRELYIRDLTLLTAHGRPVSLRQLHSPLYRQQFSRYQEALSDQQTTLERSKTNYDMNKQLFDEKVISQKEFLDRKYEYEKAAAGYRTVIEQQHSTWEDDLSRYQVESGRLNTDSRQFQKEKEWNLIKAPVSGTLQQFNGKYAGGSLQQGELVGIISPDASLVAECYLSPKDIGTIRIGMPVKFQVDAFNYNEWGLLDGKVTSIDNDFTLSGNQPVFKVKCAFRTATLMLKNGVKGQLRKGMSLQARFILTRRSLFQLLFDRTDDWINPELK